MIGYDSAFIGGTLALASFKKEFDWLSIRRASDLISENIVSCYQAVPSLVPSSPTQLVTI